MRIAEQCGYRGLDVDDVVLSQNAETPLEKRDGAPGVTPFGIEPTQRMETFGEAQWVMRSLGNRHRFSRMTLGPVEAPE